MTWTFANFAIQLIAGIAGALGAAVAAKDHSFGLFGHTIAGAAGGAFSGYFAQSLVVTVVTGSGSLNETSSVDNAVIQILAGACAGGIAMLAVGLLRHAIDNRSGVDP